MSPPWVILSLIASLALSFLMSGMEAGVFAMSRLRIRQQVRAGNPRAAALLNYLEHPEHFLWTILVGNTIANFTAVSLAVVSLYDIPWFEEHPTSYGLLILGCVIGFYGLGDLLPKMLFRTYPNRLCMAMAIPFRALVWLMRPLVWFVELFASLLLRLTGGDRFTGHLFGSRDELRSLMQETGQALSSEERVMINRVLDLQNRLVGEIAVPMDRVITIPSNASAGSLIQLRKEHGFNRYPVCKKEGGRQRVVGFVNSQRLLYQSNLDPNKSVSDFLKPALYFDAGMRLDTALRQMQRNGQRLAIVLGPDKTEVGVIALADILQTIFGAVRL